MNFDKVIQYWAESAEEDWLVVEHLFDSGDYRHALFFGHLFLEKLLKALVVQARREHAPRTHNLLFLAERADLALTEEQHNTLLRVTAYNIETRYPDDVMAARKRYDREYTEREIETIGEIGEWLKSALNLKK